MDPVSTISSIITIARQIYLLKKDVQQNEKDVIALCDRIMALEPSFIELQRQYDRMDRSKDILLTRLDDLLKEIRHFVQKNTSRSFLVGMKHIINHQKYHDQIDNFNSRLDQCRSDLQLGQAVAQADVMKRDMSLLQRQLLSNQQKMDMVVDLIAQKVTDSRLSVDASRDSAELSRNELLSGLRVDLTSFQLTGILGSGAYATVYRGRCQDSLRDDRAIKVFKSVDGTPLSSEKKRAIENEALLMRILSADSHIINCFGFVHDSLSSYLLMEYSPYGSLWDIVRDNGAFPSVPMAVMLSWMKDIAYALKYMLQRNVIHKDIKAENALLFHGLTVKICDFGLAKQLQKDVVQTDGLTVAGTENFMAPEIRLGEHSSHESDVFAWSMTCLQILTRTLPPRFISNHEDFIENAMSKFDSSVIPSTCRSILTSQLKVAVLPRDMRPSADKISESFRFLWQQFVVEHPESDEVTRNFEVAIEANASKKPVELSEKSITKSTSEVSNRSSSQFHKSSYVVALVTWMLDDRNVRGINEESAREYAEFFYGKRLTTIERICEELNDGDVEILSSLNKYDARSLVEAFISAGSIPPDGAAALRYLPKMTSLSDNVPKMVRLDSMKQREAKLQDDEAEHVKQRLADRKIMEEEFQRKSEEDIRQLAEAKRIQEDNKRREGEAKQKAAEQWRAEQEERRIFEQRASASAQRLEEIKLIDSTQEVDKKRIIEENRRLEIIEERRLKESRRQEKLRAKVC